MDHDGFLTQLELAALLRSLGLKATEDHIRVLLSSIDANGNGSIEFQELVDAILPDMNEEVIINQDQVMEVFRSFDRDGSIYITAAELEKMGQPLSYREMMQDADTNGDDGLWLPKVSSCRGLKLGASGEANRDPNRKP